MNAALLMMTTTMMAGADPVPVQVPQAQPPHAYAVPDIPPPVVVNGTGGCSGPGCAGGAVAAPYAMPYGSGDCGSGCSGSYDDCCSTGRTGLFARLRGKFSRSSSGCCGSSGYGGPARPNLLDTLRGRKHGGGGCGCDTMAPAACDCWGGCQTGGYGAGFPTTVSPAVPYTPVPATDTPQEMPKGNTDPTPDPMPMPKKPKAEKDESSDVGLPPLPAVPKTGGTVTPGAVVVPALPITPVSGPKLNGTTSPY